MREYGSYPARSVKGLGSESRINRRQRTIGAVGLDAHGKMVWKRTLSRHEVLPTFATLAATTIGIEACAGPALLTFRDFKAQRGEEDTRLPLYDARLTQAAREDERAVKLMEVPGIGKLTATAILATVADARHFDSGRDFAANLGLAPREYSSGGKQRLYGITKRGDTYLRALHIHGARSALLRAGDRPDKLLRWAQKLAERRGVKVALVPLANKIARVVWALLVHERNYVPVWSDGETRPA